MFGTLPVQNPYCGNNDAIGILLDSLADKPLMPPVSSATGTYDTPGRWYPPSHGALWLTRIKGWAKWEGIII